LLQGFQGNPEEVNESKLVDLSCLLIAIYGTCYNQHPRLKNLVEKNRITHRDFCDGKAEARCFINKQYTTSPINSKKKLMLLSNIVETLLMVH